MGFTDMNTRSNNNEGFESTYALIVRSEEKQRSRLEMVLYTLLIASVLAALSQFGSEAAALSSMMRNSGTVTASTPSLIFS